MSIHWEKYTLTGKFFVILSIINSIGIIFGYIRLFTLGGNTWEPSITKLWYDILIRLPFIFIFLSLVILIYGLIRYWKVRDSFFIEIGFISLLFSGFLFPFVFGRGLLG